MCVCVCVFKVCNITWMYLRQSEHDFVESNIFPFLCGFLGLNSHCQACASRILSCGLSHWLSKLIVNLTTMFPNHHSSTGDQTQSPSTCCRGALLLVRYLRYMMDSNEFTYRGNYWYRLGRIERLMGRYSFVFTEWQELCGKNPVVRNTCCSCRSLGFSSWNQVVHNYLSLWLQSLWHPLLASMGNYTQMVHLHILKNTHRHTYKINTSVTNPE